MQTVALKCNYQEILCMRRSRKFCQMGSTFGNVFSLFLVNEGRKDPNKLSIIGLSAKYLNEVTLACW